MSDHELSDLEKALQRAGVEGLDEDVDRRPYVRAVENWASEDPLDKPSKKYTLHFLQ